MKFYVPIMDEESHRFWTFIQNILCREGRFTTDRRIQSLLWEGNAADPRSVIVGEDLPGGKVADPVMVIQESEDFPESMMFVCTLAMFTARTPPLALAVSEHFRVVEFDEG